MYYTVCYDIGDAKTRRLAVKLCKKAGLVRMQRSVFTGRAPAALIRQIEAELMPLLKDRNDSVAVQPMDRAAFKKMRFIGKRLHKKQLAGPRLTIFV
jgi:CRISPR-associated protein Cas2